MWAIVGIYASPGYRTPPLVQGILGNCCVLFVVPFSKRLLGDQKAYLSRVPLTAAALIVASVLVSVVPIALAGGSEPAADDGSTSGARPPTSDRDTAAWTFLYLISLVPGALEGVLEQMFLIRSNALEPKATARECVWGITRIKGGVAGRTCMGVSVRMRSRTALLHSRERHGAGLQDDQIGWSAWRVWSSSEWSAPLHPYSRRYASLPPAQPAAHFIF